VAQDDGLDAALLRAPVEGPALTLAPLATSSSVAPETAVEPVAEPVAVGYAVRAQLHLEPQAVSRLSADNLLPGAAVLNSRGQVLERLQAPRPAAPATPAAPALSPEASATSASSASSPEPVPQKSLREFLGQALSAAGVPLKPGVPFEQTGPQEALRGAAPSVFLVVAQPR